MLHPGSGFFQSYSILFLLFESFTMGPKKLINNFIDSIPNNKLQNFSDKPKTLHKDQDLRLDMQGVSISDIPLPSAH